MSRKKAVADMDDGGIDDASVTLAELPADLLYEVALRCDFASLHHARMASRALRAQACTAVRSAAWRTVAFGNAEALGLARLGAATVTSTALQGLSGGVRGIDMAGNTMVTGSKDGVARVWSWPSGGDATCIAECSHPQWVGPVAISPDGGQGERGGAVVATGCDDGALRLWSSSSSVASDDGSEGSPWHASRVLRGESLSWIAGVSWVDRCRLLSCSRDGEVALWSASSTDTDTTTSCQDHSRPLASEFHRPVVVPGQRSSVLVSAFDGSGPIAAVARLGQGPQHALQKREEIALYHVGHSHPSAGASGGGPPEAVQDGILSPALVIDPRGGRVDRGPVLSLAFDGARSPTWTGDDGPPPAPTRLVSGSSWGAVHLWDVATGSGTNAIVQGGAEAEAPQQQETLTSGGEGGVRALALSGPMLVCAIGAVPRITVWDLRASRVVRKLRGWDNNDALAIDARGGRLVCGGRMGELRTWDWGFDRVVSVVAGGGVR